MNYSLLDAFLVWLGVWWLLAGVIGFFALLIGVSYLGHRLLLEREIAERCNRAELEAEMKHLRDREDAFIAEVQRREDLHDRCKESSTRYRYSRSPLRKTRI